MRLKYIKLTGFKSFVDPTPVAFPTNLTCVVGPNGCGKSNVIDACRWVMGESSAKNLRGDAMTDVIFNGSQGRKPVGHASVELVFDNSKGKLVGEYAQYNEISVKRRVTRDGQSSYYLNGSKCRRKDVVDLFLGTGMGARSYAIIEQGMISRLIESKPEELRVFLEEAAGISKYKERRRETENRIRRTQDNLARLGDLRDELDRQLQHLHRQAQSAEKYKTYKAQERHAKAVLNALKWRDLQKDSAAIKNQIQALELELEGILTGNVSADSQLDVLRVQLDKATDQFNHVQTEYYEVGSKIARIEQHIEYEHEKAKQLALDIAEVAKNLAETEEALKVDQQRIEEAAVSLAIHEPELAALGLEREEYQAQLLEAEHQQADWQERWDAFSSQASEVQRHVEVAKSTIQHLELSVERLQMRVVKSERALGQVDVGDDQSIEVLQEKVDQAEAALADEQQRLEQMNQEYTEKQKATKTLASVLQVQQGLWQEAKGRKASLEALQEAATADQGAEVIHWLQEQGLDQNPRLMQQLQVASGWEQACEIVLGSKLQAVLLDNGVFAEVLPQLDSLQQGEVSLVQTSTIDSVEHSELTDDQGALSEKILGAPAAIKPFLKRIKACENLLEVNRWLSQPGMFDSAITPEGLWIGPGWVLCMKPLDSSQSCLKRQQDLDAIITEVATLDDRVFELEADLDTHQLQLSQLEDERQQSQEQLRQQMHYLSQRRSELSALEARIQEQRKRQQALLADQAELNETLAAEKITLAGARQKWQQHLQAMEQDNDKRRVLLEEKTQAVSQLTQAKDKAQQGLDRYHQLELTVQALRQEKTGFQQALDRLNHQQVRLHERQALLLAQKEVDNPVEKLQADHQEQLALRLVLEEKMTQAKAELDGAHFKMQELEQQRHSQQQRADGVRSTLEQQRMQYQALSMRQSAHQDQVLELGLDIQQLLIDVEEMTASQESTIDGVQAEIEQLAQKIQRLGAINLAAIEEYQTQLQRKEYLDQQDADLQTALTTLENAIGKIDAETKQRFQETFEKVNQGFGELFPKVFGGGHAYLALTGDDLLSTGVTIMARPPGKKNSTIHLLSGGEKALTAIALVFSIFRLNPAPFCMLDEVDAPLDDANVGRFANLLKKMSEQVQFIYISHNKTAMEMAHQLMGVTMHEPGVSRLVSVNVEEAVELVDA